jgi:histidinol-phosphate aminotransferase
MIRTRRVLEQIPDYAPGRNPEALAAAHGITDAIKLASNETSLPPPAAVQRAIAQAAVTVNRYPDDGGAALRDAIAAFYGIDPSTVVVGPGSFALCAQAIIATCDPGDEVIWCAPTFEGYPIVAHHAGAVIRALPLRDHRYDLDAMVGAVGDRTRLLFVCTPNNPTGGVVGREEMARFLASVPSDLLVVVDEAYREFVSTDETPDGLDLVAHHPNVLVLRTFSKAYGLAGLRVGYGIGTLPVLAAIQKTRRPFGVASIGQAAALASLGAVDEIRERVAVIVAERERVTSAVRELGVEVPESHGNFVWLPLGDGAAALVEACERRGVGLRAFPGTGVRVTIGTSAENERMLGALASALSELRADPHGGSGVGVAS